MFGALYTVARWTEYAAGVLAILALLAIIVRLSTDPRRPVLFPACVLVVTGALCLGMFAFQRTRVQHIQLDSIKQLGLEAGHAGLRTNALIYQTNVSIPVTLKVLPSSVPDSALFNKVSGMLYHHTTTVNAQVAVYGLIDFRTVTAKVATVDRQARTVTLSLPNPTIGPNTTYIWSVAGVQEREAPLNAVVQSIVGPIDALLGRPVLSADAAPALVRAKAAALRSARRSPALASCGKNEIAQQLTDALNLSPAYRGYTVKINWPTAPVAGVNCAGLQAQLASAGG